MAFKVLRSTETDQDLGLILDHLVQSYLDLGDALPAAFTRAARRVGSIETDVEALHKAPFQGTLSPEILPGLRRVTKNQTVFYFDVNESEKTVRILAVFFSGQDHLRHMLKRLASYPAEGS
ncbi:MULTISPECIES: type II toxin-antitoxin system RelE/ParE family toxin [unclassified Rhizobium]|uniref:type II toxin-antitoxin system RelE/ParE family toxin n=1 Tax=unclassified Rhizobium TaxID=2613769 RepID=UPI00247B092A|nr:MULTISPECIES: type II toxin-antitoxin system RelE/ParE family toxin [unclassified Rhizobium]MDH7800236.1 plasmid stabilization system protein ParE [Rhizobium sp. AN70]